MNYKLEIENGIAVGYFLDVSNCYVQSKNPEHVKEMLKRARFIYKNSYDDRKENFHPGREKPVFNIKIKFQTISSAQLVKILNKFEYRSEYRNNMFMLFRNENLPFNRILIPNTDNLSPIIIRKLFGEKNTIEINKNVYL